MNKSVAAGQTLLDRMPASAGERVARYRLALRVAQVLTLFGLAFAGILSGQVITEFSLPTPGSGPANIAAGPDGALWFTEQDSNQIGRITTPESPCLRCPRVVAFRDPIGPPAHQTYTVLHSFQGPDGASPSAGLVQGADGSFYGTTALGGATGHGTVFRIDASGNLTTLHSFADPEGAYPAAGLTQAADGNLYGTTVEGGTGNCKFVAGCGTVFRIDTSGRLTTLHDFVGADGSDPNSAFVQASDGYFYGTTFYGGASGCPDPDARGCGTVFRIDSTGNLTTLHSFAGPEGAYPTGLIQAADEDFYGTAGSSDVNSAGGAIFRMDAAGNLTTIHSFPPFTGPGDGAFPEGDLVQTEDGSFYGTAHYGGAYEDGMIFKIDTSGNLTTLHSFSGADGAHPVAGLSRASDGTFYGTTREGGKGGCNFWRPQEGCGTVFRIDTSGNLTTLHFFSYSEGGKPAAPLVEGPDGSLYGTASWGGASGFGVLSGRGIVFKIDAPHH